MECLFEQLHVLFTPGIIRKILVEVQLQRIILPENHLGQFEVSLYEGLPVHPGFQRIGRRLEIPRGKLLGRDRKCGSGDEGEY